MASYYMPPDDKLPISRHSAVGGWFFGPRGENVNTLKKAFEFIVDKNHNTRTTTYPDDKPFITAEMMGTELYQQQIQKLEFELDSITTELAQYSVPFWSPRYNAHMLMENSMPAVIGYLAGLLNNQNNVATEASPVTTLLELEVGKDLCRMLGYNVVEKKDDTTVAVGWGHITCGGSVANLESIWSARNLKFYPISLKIVLEKGPLAYLQGLFEIELCTGEKKNFMKCSTWELLNLKPSTVLNIPDQLYQQFGVSSTVLSNILPPWTIQTTGKDYLEKRFSIEKPARMFVGTTKHYSWPKGGAITGIGSGQIVDVPVDDQARMDPEQLRKFLEESLQAKQAVYSVVAIIGSTEHGAVDPLDKILALRTEFEKRGLSFVIHCDGAWGAYFASLLRKPEDFPNTLEGTLKGVSTYVPTLALSPYTERQLDHLQYADSITIDPHKSGYCPYPAGGLCYRDGRQRFLVTWTSPVVYRGNVATDIQSIGIYGVEGSKPGAAPVGAYLSHSILGLHDEGYGTLLGEAILTCSRLYCHWATMEPKPLKIDGVEVKLVVRTFTMLPAERNEGSPEQIEEQKQFIRDNILNKTNEEIYANERAVELLKQLGGDIQINNFACNFEIDGKVNTDIIEANYLNTSIFQSLSISTTNKKLEDIPLYLTSTQFTQNAYKSCLTKYKNRLGLQGPEDLYTLINVTMSPWSTTYNFLQVLADAFESVAGEALKAIVQRNVQTPDHHGFIVQGLEGSRVCGVHLPMFNMQNHRWQLIISCNLPDKELNELRERKKNDPTTFFTFGNKNLADLNNLIEDGASFEAGLQEGFPWDGKPISDSMEVTNIRVLYRRSMMHKDLALTYPDHMMFYAYSAQKGSEDRPIFHVDHLLNVSPSMQLNSDTIVFSTADQEKAEQIVKDSGAWFSVTDIHESALQPFIQEKLKPKTIYDMPGIWWKPGNKYTFEARAAKIPNTPPSPNDPVIFKGTLTLGSAVFADAVMVNADGGADQDNASTVALGDPGTNASGLVDEHPSQHSTMPELRYLYQQSKMSAFEQHFRATRARKAEELVQSCKDSEQNIPEWAKSLSQYAGRSANGDANGYTDGGDNPSALSEATTKMYHSHL